jgi:hypothetical protein
VRTKIGGHVRPLLLGLVMVAGLGLTACGPSGPAANPVEDAIRLYFSNNAPAAMKVAKCESGLNPRAVSPGGGNHGLFQINNVHAKAFVTVTGRPWSDRYDPYANSQYASWLFFHSGWGPWACKRVL